MTSLAAPMGRPGKRTMPGVAESRMGASGRGVSFPEAVLALEDPHALSVADDVHPTARLLSG